MTPAFFFWLVAAWVKSRAERPSVSGVNRQLHVQIGCKLRIGVGLTPAMDNLYLGHLSRPQLVNLLPRIVDLLAQPLPQPEQPLHPGQAMQAPPILEPYDASISPDVRRPRPMHGTVYPTGPLNPGATAFYPMVPGANCSQRAGVTSEPSPEPAPGLPHFDLTPFTLASQLQAYHPHGVGGVPTNTNVPINSMYHSATPEGQLASPAQVGEVHQMRPCGCKCELCDSLCVLQRRGHTTHLCLLHKIP